MTDKKEKETAVTVYDPNSIESYTAAGLTISEEMAEVLESALIEGDELGQSDLPRVMLPQGTSNFFQMPDGQPAEDFLGVVIHQDRVRAYFSKPFDETGGEEPPDCASSDAMTARPGGMYAEGSDGNPTGKCADCPISQFLPNEDGERQAPQCAERVRLFMARPGVGLPTIVSISPAGLGKYKEFRNTVIASQVPMYGVTAHVYTEPAENNAGVKYRRVIVEVGDVLPDDAKEVAKRYRADWRPRLMQQSLEQRDL